VPRFRRAGGQDRLDPPGAALAGSPAELLEFAVGQVLREDSAVGALPVLLARLAGLFGCRAALAFQEDASGELVVLAAFPQQAGTKAELRSAIRALTAAHREDIAGQGYFQATLVPGPPPPAGPGVSVLMASSPETGGRRLCSIALVGDASHWDNSCRATTRALAAIVAAQIRHTNDTIDLAERRARTEALIEGAPDAIVVAGPDGRLQVFNAAAEELTGWPRDQVLGRDMAGVLAPERDRAAFRSAARGPAGRGRFSLLRADGAERLAELTPLTMTVDGHPITCVFIRDLSELDRAHAELRDTEERFRLMSQLAPVGIMQTDEAGRSVFANERWREMLGLTEEQARGAYWSDGLHPDDIGRVRQEWEEAARHDGELRTDSRLRPAGDAESWVHIAIRPVLGASGRPAGWLAALTNVSERKRAEAERERLLAAERGARQRLAEQTERLNGLVAAAIPGILFDDERGRITQVNQSFCDLFGLPDDPASLIGTRTWRVAIRIKERFADPSGFLGLTRKLVSHRTPVALEEMALSDGRTFEWDYAPVFVGGEYRGNLWGMDDATGRHDLAEQRERLLEAEFAARAAAERAQQRLTERNARLQELDEAKTEFLATMSHELRTPLTSIISFTELILDDASQLPADTVDSLAVIQRNGDRLLRLLGDLLLLSRLEARAISLELGSVAVPGLIREAVRSVSATAADRGIEVTASTHDGPLIKADLLRLQQVMDNLLSNAIKFSGRGGRVEVSARPEGQMWRIDVTDEGIGIPADELGKLFGRFVRATNARMAGLPGTGLGLSVVKAIAELHGGRVEVRSTIELGSTFSVFLPAADQPAAAQTVLA
jgi:PAS domain S-box-containing protein